MGQGIGEFPSLPGWTPVRANRPSKSQSRLKIPSEVPVSASWPVVGRDSGVVDREEWEPVKAAATREFYNAGIVNYPGAETKGETRRAFWQIVDEVIANYSVFEAFREGWEVICETRDNPGNLDSEAGHDIFYWAIRSIFREYSKKAKSNIGKINTRGLEPESDLEDPLDQPIGSDPEMEFQMTPSRSHTQADARIPTTPLHRHLSPPPEKMAKIHHVGGAAGTAPESIDAQYAVRYDRTVYIGTIGSRPQGSLMPDSEPNDVQWSHGRLPVPTFTSVAGLGPSNHAVMWVGLLINIRDVNKNLSPAQYILLHDDAAVCLWLDMAHRENIGNPVVLRMPMDSPKSW